MGHYIVGESQGLQLYYEAQIFSDCMVFDTTSHNTGVMVQMV